MEVGRAVGRVAEVPIAYAIAGDRIVGFSYLRGVHLNDSKAALGSRVDRHAPIGKGQVGLETFRLIMNDRRFDGIPLIPETPESERWSEEIRLLYALIEKTSQQGWKNGYNAPLP